MGTPRDLYCAPDNLYVARMVGSPPINILPAAAVRNDQFQLSFLQSSLEISSAPDGKKLAIGLRPHDLVLA